MKYLFFCFAIAIALTSCSDNDDFVPEEEGPFDRTVLVYMSGENNLSRFIKEELEELKDGSKNIGQNALVVYVDEASSQNNPYILRIANGVVKDSVPMTDEALSSDPSVFAKVLSYTSTNYPASEYGLVLWGHASGWLFEDSVEVSGSRRLVSGPLKAFGADTGNNRASLANLTWMNIPTMAQVLSKWGQHLIFIMADCCQFQCIEAAYELRNCAEYIIASPAEIPGKGAPYVTVTKHFFSKNTDFYKDIVDSYFAQVIKVNYVKDWSFDISYNARTPLSVIKTSELPSLATATSNALKSIEVMSFDKLPKLHSEKLIYYYGNVDKVVENCMYDMNDIFLHYADSSIYSSWKKAFDQAVVYKVNARDGWMTDKQILPYVFGKTADDVPSTQVLTDERYGGVSMFVPQKTTGTWYFPYKNRNGHDANGYNADIKKTAWYHAAKLSELGW